MAPIPAGGRQDMTGTSRPKLAITASTGWIVRNFFQTGIIAGLLRHFDVLVIATPVIRDQLLAQGYLVDGIECITRDDLEEPRSWRYLRQLRKKLYMDSRQSATDRIWERHVRRPLYQRWGAKVIEGVVAPLDARRLLEVAESVDFRFNRSERAAAILSEHAPDLLFATHASTYFEESLLHEAVRHRIPTVFMVLSWDHLSSKVVMCGRYDRVMVWNRVTREEILATMDAYTPGQIQVVGVPQFDCYAQRPSVTYEEWCRGHQLDPSRRTILFSTMPQVRHDGQHLIIERILEEIRAARQLPVRLQMLIKCHPFDNTNLYDRLLDSGFPVAIQRSTLRPGQRQEDWFPSPEEMIISRDALYFCAVNINIFSTVTLEAAYLDKPIVHVAFDTTPVVNRIPCREFYNFDHFRRITESGAAVLAENFDQLFAGLREGLGRPEARASQRRSLVADYFHGAPGTAASEVVSCLVEFQAAQRRAANA
jgi:hypothetical protein